MAFPPLTQRQNVEQFEAPYRWAAAITPNDSTDLGRPTKAIYVGGAGAIAVNMDGDNDVVTFAAVPVGAILPIEARRVRATGTTATNLVAIW